MSGFVIDASAALPWYFRDEATSWTESLLERATNGEPLFAPAHFLFEITNALRVAERKGRLDSGEADAAVDDLLAFRFVIAGEPSREQLKEVLALSRKHTLTVYDAAYLELANRLGLELATLDRALVHIAERTGVSLA